MKDKVDDIHEKPKKAGEKTSKPADLNPVPQVKKQRSALTRTTYNLADDETMGGVTVFWLAKAFGMEVSSVRKKMADCPPMARRAGGFLYSLPIAAQYLVKPRVDLEHYLQELKPVDLPQKLQAAFWDAQLKRTKFQTQMKDLWHTEDVMEVFAEVFKKIKYSVQLWPDMVERDGDLTEDDQELLVGYCDSLQDEIYKAIAKLTREKSTPNALQRFNEAIAEKERSEVAIYDDDGDGDDLEDIL